MPRQIENKIKEVNDSTLRNVEEFQRITENHERLCRSLAQDKNKYQKSFLEWDEAKANYIKADSNPTVSRNEIAKLEDF